MEILKGTGTALVCPLGWGLGHASRVIPIITQLQQHGWRVIVAANPASNALIKGEIPLVETLPFPSLQVKLYSGLRQILNLIIIAIRLLIWTHREHKLLQGLICKHKVDLIVSDNRYGLYSQGVRSVLITHLLNIKPPTPFGWSRPLGRWFVARHAKRFTQCWVPDNPNGLSVSGSLSLNKYGLNNVVRIGLLSRFKDMEPERSGEEWDLVGVVSGPEPQRSRFEQELIMLAKRMDFRTLIVRGQPIPLKGVEQLDRIELRSHTDSKALARALISAKHIICRSGYSTIMDLIALNRSALLVPTPGQTEQEYLAKHLSKKGWFKSCRQGELSKLTKSDLAEAMVGSNYKGFNFFDC